MQYTELKNQLVLSADFQFVDGYIREKNTGYIVYDVDLTNLQITSRASNALKRVRITSLYDLMSKSIKEIAVLRGIGRESLINILETANAFVRSQAKPIANTDCGEKVKAMFDLIESIKHVYTVAGIGVHVRHTSLPIRAQNALICKEIYTVEQLIWANLEEIQSLRNIGIRTINEISSFRSSILESFWTRLCNLDNSAVQKLVSQATSFTDAVKTLEIKDEHYEAKLILKLLDHTSSPFDPMEIWWNDKTLKTIFYNKVLRLVREACMAEINYASIKSELSSQIPDKILQGILNQLVAENLITCDGEVYRPCCCSVLNVAKSVLTDRFYHLFTERLGGKTFDVIASENLLTKERIRQIMISSTAKISKYCEDNHLILEETKLKHFFENYLMKESDFVAITNDPISYRYMQLVFDKGVTPWGNALSDKKIPLALRQKIAEHAMKARLGTCAIIYEEDGSPQIRSRYDLENHIIETMCKSDTNFDDFANMYNEYLRELGLFHHPGFAVYEEINHSRGTQLSNNRNLLWKYGRKFRAYDIDSRNYKVLYQELNLGQYHNTIISALKLYCEHPQLMKRYDIHDEYELHDLLRKTGAEKKYKDLKFERNPTLRFGNIKRKELVLGVMKGMAPVHFADLARALSQEFGFSYAQATTWVQYVEEYGRDGVFDTNIRDISVS